MTPTKFVALFDLHWGFERRGGHKVALHDPKALNVALEFIDDFEPDVVILGGDMLDCGAISHHAKGKPGQTEGLKLLADAQELRKALIGPLERLKPAQLVYITGNHERFLTDLTDTEPGLEGIVDLRALLQLDDRWKIVPQGGCFHLGKLTFLHGDQLGGGEHVAKKAVTDYERSVRFGHHHSYQAYTKCSPLEAKHGKSGILVPCLCRKDPAYMRGKANKWVQGFLSGYVLPNGNFHDYVTIINEGKAVAPNGKVYCG